MGPALAHHGGGVHACADQVRDELHGVRVEHVPVPLQHERARQPVDVPERGAHRGIRDLTGARPPAGRGARALGVQHVVHGAVLLDLRVAHGRVHPRGDQDQPGRRTHPRIAQPHGLRDRQAATGRVAGEEHPRSEAVRQVPHAVGQGQRLVHRVVRGEPVARHHHGGPGALDQRVDPPPVRGGHGVHVRAAVPVDHHGGVRERGPWAGDDHRPSGHHDLLELHAPVHGPVRCGLLTGPGEGGQQLLLGLPHVGQHPQPLVGHPQRGVRRDQDHVRRRLRNLRQDRLGRRTGFRVGVRVLLHGVVPRGGRGVAAVPLSAVPLGLGAGAGRGLLTAR